MISQLFGGLLFTGIMMPIASWFSSRYGEFHAPTFAFTIFFVVMAKMVMEASTNFTWGFQ